MRIPEADRRGATILHRAAPRLKLAVLLIVLIGTVLLPRRPDFLYLAPAAVLLLGWVLSRMPLGYALRRLAVAQVFIVSVGFLSLLSHSGGALFIGTELKSNLCVLGMILLTWTTPFHDVLRELKSLGLPPIMVTTLALMHRYLPVLTEESRRMQRARASRTFGRNRRLGWQNVSVIIGQLFIRSVGRAERIYLAMCARGWK